MENNNNNNQALYSHMLYYDPPGFPYREKDSGPNAIDPSAGTELKLPMVGPIFGPYKPMPCIEIDKEGNVLIRYYAPDAKRVQIGGTGGSMTKLYDMEKGKEGIWTVLLHDIPPGIHCHMYLVDGVLTLNPAAPLCISNHYAMNYFDIPYPDQDFYLLKDVPHGTLHMEQMKSDITGRWRNIWVYTPPGYDAHREKRYPVMYIQHGGGENETSWFWKGKLHYISDNLLAEGACEEMLLVCACGYATEDLKNGLFEDTLYERVLIEEIVPFIDSRYRTIRSPENRAIAGLSMGGGQAKQIAFSHTDVFANLGQFSSASGFVVEGGVPDYSELFSSPEYFASRMRVTFVTCGTHDPRLKYTSEQVKQYIERGFNIEFNVYSGYHEWNVWRFSARDFMKRLFRK